MRGNITKSIHSLIKSIKLEWVHYRGLYKFLEMNQKY